MSGQAAPPTAPPPYPSSEPHFYDQRGPEAAMDFRQKVLADLASTPSLSEDQVVEAIENYAAGHCCYGDGLVKGMIVKDILPTPIYVYDLEMFVETRVKDWVTEPYRGEYLAQENRFEVPVDFWSVPIAPPVRFGTAKHSTIVPGSTTVVNCAQCTGIGNVQCGICAGSMTTTCSACSGTGSVDVLQSDATTRRVKCIKCKGMRRTTCDACAGKGTSPCKSCKGFRRVKNYEMMDVTWSTVLVSSVHKERGQVSVAKLKFGPLKKTTVAEVCSMGPMDILPFTMFRTLLDTKYSAQCAIPHQRVLELRQRVHLYPATEVVYSYKSRDRSLLIYGHEQQVYFPQGYPQSCCVIA